MGVRVRVSVRVNPEGLTLTEHLRVSPCCEGLTLTKYLHNNKINPVRVRVEPNRSG